VSNPLISLKNLLQKKDPSYRISQVIAVDGEKLTTQTETGVTMTVWGQAALHDWVISKDDQVLGKISQEEIQSVYIA